MALLFGCSTIVALLSLVSLAFLIIASITPPASDAFGIAEDDKIIYGVLGYCFLSSSKCVTGSPFYKVSELTTQTDWKMNDSARDTLAKILIVTPIAGFLTLLSFLFNVLCHFKAIGSSLVFNIFTFFFTLLSFLSTAITVIVVFLCFYPHVKWPAWLLLPAGVLTLISIPLAFFALRTNPSTTDDEEEELNSDQNLTDLSDGGLFKNNSESFKLDNFLQPPHESSTSVDKKSYSAVKVVTDDSSSANHYFEKVTPQDYSKASNDPSASGYQGYNLDSTSQHNDTYPPTAYSDGTPNLVSAQHYNKGGATVTEAPKFIAQSAKPDYGTTPYSSTYPSAAFSTQVSPPTALGTSAKLNKVSSRSGSSAASGSLGAPRKLVSQESEHPISNHTAGNSTLGDLYNDYDDEIPDDDGSDFTSVSQRAANPNYYRGLQHNGPKLFPNERHQPQQTQHPQGYYQPQQSQQPQVYYNPQQSQQRQGYYSPQQQSSQGVYPPPQQFGSYQSNPQERYSGHQSSQSSYNGYFSGALPPQQQQQQQQQQRPQRDTSDIVLNANPDFAIGGPAYQKKSYPKRPGQIPSGSYRPAYKKLNQNSGKTLPAASLSADSPYSIK